MQRSAAPVLLLLSALSAGLLFTFRSYAADDAYILIRFGVNLVDHGELVFNAGEFVSSMTSPALALLYALLHALFGEPLVPYKVLSVAALVGSVVLVLRHAPAAPADRALFLALVALCPSLVMWTFGGLETPMLMIVVTGATHLALLAHAPEAGTRASKRAIQVCALAGLGFLLRHDAAPYLGAVCLFALMGRSLGTWALGIGAGAVLPVAWLAFAYLYYGDLLPTSYYTKPPRAGWATLGSNAIYIGENLFLTGVIPLAVLILAGTRRRAGDRLGFVRSHWGLLLGLSLQLAYTLTMATVHMMFGFRAFLPYLPATALLLAAWLRSRGGFVGRRGQAVAWSAVSVLVFSGLAQGWYTWTHEMNGLATQGRPQDVSAAEATRSLDVLGELAGRIREDWARRGVSPARPPTIFTITEGILPYRYPEAYYVGPLVAYRHACSVSLPAIADYVVRLRNQERLEERDVANSVIAGPFTLSGRVLYAEAAYNPAPKPDRLPTTLAGPCPPPRPDGSAE